MITICIIEDLQEILKGLQAIIAANPNFVLLKCFDNAEDAIEEIPALCPQIILTDIALKGKTGIDCIVELKPLLPQTHFIMFTIYEDDNQVFEALKAGATGYILKNMASDKIIEALLDLSEGGSPMSPKIARKVLSSFNAQPDDRDIHRFLSKRENEVLDFLGKGFLYREIAEKLGISLATVKRHITHIYHKLQVGNKTQALNKMYGKQA